MSPVKLDLTAPELFLLARGPDSISRGVYRYILPDRFITACFKLALLELTCRGFLKINQIPQSKLGSSASTSAPMTVFCPGRSQPYTRLGRSLKEVFSLYISLSGQTFPGGIKGQSLDALLHAQNNHYGMESYVSKVVLPALIEHGYYHRSEKRFLWVIPDVEAVLTPSGIAAKRYLEALVEDAHNNFTVWVDRKPHRAAQFLASAGGAIFLLGSLRSDIERLYEKIEEPDLPPAEEAMLRRLEIKELMNEFEELWGNLEDVETDFDSASDGDAGGDGDGGGDGGSWDND